jgi:hypothetical protein
MIRGRLQGAGDPTVRTRLTLLDSGGEDGQRPSPAR